MTNDVPQRARAARPARRTLRLTFRFSAGEVRLQSVERLEMICPPSIGEPPEAGKNGGFWMELRDQSGRVLFHRLLHNPLRNSVEVHSPGGKIERIFGDVKEATFEVLLPDEPAGDSVALMGETLAVHELNAGRYKASRELARFEIPGSGGTDKPGGAR